MFYCKCEKCGYGFEADLGFGFLYPVAYCEAVTKMKEGNLGEQGKEFFEAFPDVFEQYNHRCTSCNGYASVVQGFTDCTDDSIDRHVQCPKCKSMLEIRPFGHWD